MLRFTTLGRPTARLALLVPVVLLAVACGDDAAGDGPGTGVDGGVRDGSTGVDGSTGADGSNGVDGGGMVAPDTTPPTVLSNDPLTSATGEATTTAISATFSEPMAPLTLTAATFSVKQGATEIPGSVTYFDNTVSFSPTADLALNTTYTATVSTGAKDLAGNALGAAHTWSFTTDSTAPSGPAPVLLRASGGYAILAKSAITNVPTSAVTGNLGISPAAASYITGFALTRAGTKWTSPQVVGSVFAADNDAPTPSNLTTAISNMETAYTDAAGRPTPTSLDLGAGSIGGLTLAPGLYKWSSAVTIPTDVVISGTRNDTWIFQISGDLTMSSARRMNLVGGARAKNIVWQVAGAVNFGTTSHAEGVVLSKTAITLATGASINGRLLAQTAVNIAGSAVKVPAQ